MNDEWYIYIYICIWYIYIYTIRHIWFTSITNNVLLLKIGLDQWPVYHLSSLPVARQIFQDCHSLIASCRMFVIVVPWPGFSEDHPSWWFGTWILFWNMNFIFPYWESSSQLTNMFQRSWNHQPDPRSTTIVQVLDVQLTMSWSRLSRRATWVHFGPCLTQISNSSVTTKIPLFRGCFLILWIISSSYCCPYYRVPLRYPIFWFGFLFVWSHHCFYLE